MLETFFKILSPAQRKLIIVFYDALCISSAYFIKCVVFSVPMNPLTIGLFLLFYFLGSSFLGGYKKVWRFFSTIDFLKLFLNFFIALSATLLLQKIFFSTEIVLAKSLFFMFVSFNLVSLGRGIYKFLRTRSFQSDDFKKVLIVGAGEAGEQLYREIFRNTTLKMKVLGFIDDDKSKIGAKIHGVKIFGNISNLAEITESLEIDEVLLAIPSASTKQMKRILDIAMIAHINIRTLPAISHILKGKINLNQIKNVEPEDLLGRDPVNLDLQEIKSSILKKNIMVTGGGGSIGSELCVQIGQFHPTSILIFEQCELFLYDIERKLAAIYPEIKIIPIIGDIRNKSKVNETIAQFKPDIIFHAAAYKHVPLMESNIGEAILTNIMGTKVVAESAVSHNVSRFLLISSDKAVNPTNIMGTTKKVAEQVCQLFNQSQEKTKFIIVRFGNVLGSNGSVIPLFKEQIKNGGPVTVTDENIVRYFMSIPEAAQLVLQAGTMGGEGEIFHLDMGEPVKILDLARDMITFSGLKPDIDIKIEITGLRPGEKLYEELVATEENSFPTQHIKLKKIKVTELDQDVNNLIKTLISLAQKSQNQKDQFITILKELVPTFHQAKISKSSEVKPSQIIH